MDRARQRSRGRQLLRAVAIVIAGAAVAGPVAGSAGAARTAAGNQAAGRSDARSLLGKLRLPSGASRSTAEPPGDAGVLAYPGSSVATPNLIDEPRWWVLDGTPEDAVAYIDAHRPLGSTLLETGSGGGPNRPTTTIRVFAWPPIRGVLGARLLALTVVALSDGRTGIRADAEDVWVTPRPASEKVPGGVKLLTVAMRGCPGVTSRPRVIHSPGSIQQIVALANQLPAAQPGTSAGGAESGPDVTVTVAFLGAHGSRPLARLTAYRYGAVAFWLGSKAQPGLTDAKRVFARLKALGAIPTCPALTPG